LGDWGWGMGDWGLGPIPNPQSPIPNPQSPIPNYFISKIIIIIKIKYYINNNIYININDILYKYKRKREIILIFKKIIK